MKLIFLFCLLIPIGYALSSESKPLGNPTAIDDGDKGSSHISDMITGVQQAQKAVDVANAAATVGNAAKDPTKTLEKFKNVKPLDELKSLVKNTVVSYKSTKGGFDKLLNDVLNKTSNLLQAANKRVNMWRTTEPMLLSYGHRMHKVADNTVEVFGDFKPSDLVDIDRKWSKGVEAALLDDKSTIMGFNSFLQTRFNNVSENEKMFSYLFVGNDIADRLSKTEMGLRALMEMPGTNPYRGIPIQTLGFTSEAVITTRAIAAQAHGNAKEDESVSQETFNFKQIREAMEDKNQTYEDTKQISVLISRRRAEVGIQNTQIEQVLSLLQVKYTRLLLRNKETPGSEYQDYHMTLNKILNGGEFKTIDAHRREIFQEASLGH